MKQSFRPLSSSLFALAATLAFSTAALAADPAPAPTLPKCDKPIASVMVGKMQCKAANCGGGQGNQAGGIAALLALAQAQNGGTPLNVTGIADGIKDVLVTALTESGCFDVQDREAMDEIAKELEMAGKKVQTQQADFLVSGAVTQIEVTQDNKSLGGGLLGAITSNPIIGAVAGGVGFKTQKASVGLDMKLVNVNTAKVVASKRAEASSETSSFTLGGGVGAGGTGGIAGFGGSLSSLKGTNLEAVTKDAIVQSVHFLVDAARTAKPAVAAAPAN